MTTRLILREGEPHDEAFERAADVLRSGGLVAFPTETVYGLGARADDESAVRSIFEAKGRSARNPLIVHVADVAGARRCCAAWSDEAEALSAFWPGPLTLVVHPSPATRIAASVMAGGNTLALRVPAHPVAHELLARCALPIAAPSANRSLRLSPTTADHVMKMLAGRIDVCLDAGPTGFGIESTIVDVTQSPAVLLRTGAIATAAIAQRIAIVDGAGRSLSEGQALRAPGGYARHYAPTAPTQLVDSQQIQPELERLVAQGERVGLLVRTAMPSGSPTWLERSVVETLPDEPVGYARELYAALHRLEDANCSRILVEAPPSSGEWAAIADRLRRASAGEP